MAMGLCLILSVLMLGAGIAGKVFTGIPLAGCLLVFVIQGLFSGYSGRALGGMMLSGAKKSSGVLSMLLMIGGMTGTWMLSGTIPAMVYHSLGWISPHTFLLLAFLISSMVSLTIGTANGTASIIGIPLILMAHSSGVSPAMAAGAVISGAYFGDRSSPMSSSAVLVAGLTGTDLYTNIRRMLRTAAVPFLMTAAFFGGLSLLFPADAVSPAIQTLIPQVFRVNLPVLVPVGVVLVMCLLRAGITPSLLAGAVSGGLMAMLVQKQSLLTVLQCTLIGYTPPGGTLSAVFSGGGVLSVLKACMVVLTACALSEVMNGTGVLRPLKARIEAMAPTGRKRFCVTLLTGLMTGALGCSQSIAVIMSGEILAPCYRGDREQLALDMENSCILTSALIPWNIAALLCTSTLQVSMTGFIPFAFFLYAVPLWAMFRYETGHIFRPRRFPQAQSQSA